MVSLLHRATIKTVMRYTLCSLGCFIQNCYFVFCCSVTVYNRVGCDFVAVYRFINARRRIVQPMIDQSNRAGEPNTMSLKYHIFLIKSCQPAFLCGIHVKTIASALRRVSALSRLSGPVIDGACPVENWPRHVQCTHVTQCSCCLLTYLVTDTKCRTLMV